jgi:hypothetical protein
MSGDAWLPSKQAPAGMPFKLEAGTRELEALASKMYQAVLPPVAMLACLAMTNAQFGGRRRAAVGRGRGRGHGLFHCQFRRT